MFADHLDLKHPLAWTIDDALTPDLCDAYVAKMRRETSEVAPITTGVDLAVRNNTRVMWDDEREANELLARVADRVPMQFRDETRAGANPRLRLYHYAAAERHGLHFDTVVELPDEVRSRLTLVFYLNEGFEGGATDFPEIALRVEPRRGRALVFQHRVLHQAMAVTAGEKFVLRTDVLYRRPRPISR